MKVPFRDVSPGERFSTPYSKRLSTCVKIGPTDVGDGVIRNAVILLLLDHAGRPADDHGCLLAFDDTDEVEVDVKEV